MTIKNFWIAACVILAFCACEQKMPLSISVTNSTIFDRNGELVEVSMEDINTALQLPDTARFVVLNEAGQQLPYQITYDGNVIFPASVKASSTSNYIIQEGEPEDFETSVFGKQYPESNDDVAWENDKVAFRAYGPALANTGMQFYGYDLWCKRVSDLVVEKRYAREMDAEIQAQIDSLRLKNKKAADELQASISSSVDHGDGLDCYRVGPTLGAGTSAIMTGDSIIYPYVYRDLEILDNGPLRFTVQLSYEPFVLGKDTAVIETRLISLDKGSQLNKTVVTYRGLSQQVDVVTGIVLHEPNATKYIMDKKLGYMGYEDPTQDIRNNNGKIYVGAVFPSEVKDIKPVLFSGKERELRGGALGHLLAFSQYQPMTSYTYYWGDGWSKSGFATMMAWQKYLEKAATSVRNPLIVTVE